MQAAALGPTAGSHFDRTGVAYYVTPQIFLIQRIGAETVAENLGHAHKINDFMSDKL